MFGEPMEPDCFKTKSFGVICKDLYQQLEMQ